MLRENFLQTQGVYMGKFFWGGPGGPPKQEMESLIMSKLKGNMVWEHGTLQFGVTQRQEKALKT